MPSSPKVFNMNYARLPLRFALSVFLTVVLASMLTYGQARSSLRGLITDELGAAIVGANVTLTDATGAQKKTTTNAEGVYTFTGLSAGKYAITAAAPGFAASDPKEVDVTSQRQSFDLTLKVTIEEKVTIGAE